MIAGQSHATSIVVNAPARRVFKFMADPEMLPRWSFGTWTIERLEAGIVRGKSLFDGSTILVRIVPDEARLAVDYHLGPEPEKMAPRIMVRIVPGPTLGLGEDVSVLTFLAWRSAVMDDHRWRRLTASHELEVVLIKSLFESGQIT